MAEDKLAAFPSGKQDDADHDARNDQPDR